MTLAAVALELGDYAVIGGMLLGLGSILTTLNHFTVKTLARRIEVVETRVTEIEKTKADKHDWARESLNARSAMLSLSGKIEKLDGKLDASFGIGAGLNRLVDELRKYAPGQESGNANRR